MFTKPLFAVFTVVLCTAVGRPAQAGDWDKYKGDCDQVLKGAKTAVLERLKECVGLWTAYKDPAQVRAGDRPGLKSAFQILYSRAGTDGDDEGQYLAIQAAERAGVTLDTTVQAEAAAGKAPAGQPKPQQPAASEAKPKREKFLPPKVSKAQQRKAQKLVKKGIKAFKKKKRAKARKYYEQALEADPGNLDAMYNLAAEEAFRQEAKAAVIQLEKLQDIGSSEANKRLRSARTDPDFEPIHDNVRFKRATGFARIKVVNSIKEYGEDEVDRIVRTCKKLKHVVADVGVDKKLWRTRPVIWFKPHSAPTAYVLKKVVIHPETVMTRITWKSDYDIIVTWGNKLIGKGDDRRPSKEYADASPAEGEKRLDDLYREEDKALREPEKVARKVDHAVDTPNRVINKGESAVNRVERTMKTIEGTGKKVINMPDRFK